MFDFPLLLMSFNLILAYLFVLFMLRVLMHGTFAGAYHLNIETGMMVAMMSPRGLLKFL